MVLPRWAYHETEDESEYDGSSLSAGCTAEASNAQAHEGSWSLECITDGGYENAIRVFYDESHSTFSAGCHVRLDELPADGATNYVLKIWDDDWAECFRVGIQRVGANYYLKVYNPLNVGDTTKLSGSPITVAVGTWYHIEINITVKGAAGHIDAYWEYVKEIDWDCDTESGSGDNDFGQFGFGVCGSASAQTCWVDNCHVTATYVPPEGVVSRSVSGLLPTLLEVLV